MSVCKWVRIFYLWRPNLRDEADNHLVELAIAGNAQIIVTRNVNDFRRSQLLFPQLKILNSAILYAEVSSAYLALKPEQGI